MRVFFVVLVSAAALLAADPQAKKQEAKKQAPPQKVTDGSKQMEIPEAATRTPDGDYHYTDPQGKKWVYRKTPFGVRKLDEQAIATESSTTPDATGIKATEEGDMVKFERRTPFGLAKWEKKKSELDVTEKTALQNSRSEKPSKQE